ncbi:hypothetical protein KAR91_46775 [Candidatus Pacearchaeota archaeon]|nr:hypothetical protein [Candidatus Pacearchaeota archaeon]
MKRILKAKKTIDINNGKKTGKITKFTWRSKPYDYIDIHINFKNENDIIEIRAGFPAIISYNTKLGQLLLRFGKDFHENEDIDIEAILMGQIVIFDTFTEINDKGSFAKVKVDSIKPRGVSQ